MLHIKVFRTFCSSIFVSGARKVLTSLIFEFLEVRLLGHKKTTKEMQIVQNFQTNKLCNFKFVSWDVLRKSGKKIRK